MTSGHLDQGVLKLAEDREQAVSAKGTKATFGSFAYVLATCCQNVSSPGSAIWSGLPSWCGLDHCNTKLTNNPWLTPTAIANPRLFKISFTLDL